MKQYMFEIPFAGTMTVWTDAESEAEARQAIMRGDWNDSDETYFESEAEARQAIMRGDWNDSDETYFESRPEESMILLQVDELTEDGEIEE